MITSEVTDMSFPAMYLFFDDVEIGQEWDSLGRTVTETDIVTYAGLSGDFNPIHMDHEYARTTAYRKPIAHGLLIWAISSGLGMMAPPMRTMAFVGIRDWQFKLPVYVGDTIRIKTKVMDIEERSRGRRAIITWLRTITNQSRKIVQEGITLTLVEGRANIREARDT
ncbi:MAG TPA: MaoC/PaaZ C-terminal domain-containing protein [Gemmataceae bacterium]|nr:MaoC/PaaZ C-terminal domain-containing protein [Gemmataceae bacterium]